MSRLAAPWLIGPVLLLALAACTRASPASFSASPAQTGPTTAEVPLPFETIARDCCSEYYALHALEPPRSLLVPSRSQAATLAEWFRPVAEQPVLAIDYERYFAVAVFRGRFGSGGYGVYIDQVTRRGRTLVVYARYWDPSPFYTQPAIEVAPYVVAKVQRDGGPLDDADLVLQVRVVTPTPPSR